MVTHGPHFETTAEINAIEKLGGEVVGMTMPSGMQTQAAELGIPYAAILVHQVTGPGKERSRKLKQGFES